MAVIVGMAVFLESDNLKIFVAQFDALTLFRNGIRKIMDNYPEWEKVTRNRLRFGKTKVKGYLRKHDRQNYKRGVIA